MNCKWLSLLFLIQLQCSVLGVLQDKIPTPEFDFKSLSIKEISFTDITLKLETSVTNPYPVALASSLLDMDLKVEGLNLSHIKTDLGAIEAKKTKTLPLDVKFKYTDLLNLYQKFPDKQFLELSCEGDMKVPIPKEWQLLGKDSITIPFTKKREIPAVMPNVEIKNFNILMPSKEDILSSSNSTTVATQALNFLDGLLGGKGKKTGTTSATQAGLAGLNLPLKTEFDFEFTNQAAANLLLSGLGYDLKLAGENFLSGSPKEIINSGKTSTARVSTTFPLASISSSLYKTIQTRTATFDLKGNSQVELKELQEKIPFLYEKKGNFRW